jgi:predicted ABC-type exoprotein transport system permease subunit
VLESFVELYVFIIGFQLECLLHQFWVVDNYWRCIPVDEEQKKLCHARQASKTIWDLKMGQKLSSLK